MPVEVIAAIAPVGMKLPSKVMPWPLVNWMPLAAVAALGRAHLTVPLAALRLQQRLDQLACLLLSLLMLASLCDIATAWPYWPSFVRMHLRECLLLRLSA